MIRREFTLATDESGQEFLKDITRAFPMAVYTGAIRTNEEDIRYVVPWHWHKEFEINVVLAGRERVFFGEESTVLERGEGAFINANTLHMSEQAEGGSAHMAVLFGASMIGGPPQSAIEERYVTPLAQCEALRGVRLSPGVPWQAAVLDACHDIEGAYRKKPYGYELYIQRKLSDLWYELALNSRGVVEGSAHKKTSPDYARVKTMLSYIDARYHENLSLHDIASSASISVSECCRCFKRVLSTTPFAYLLQLRLNTAARLLRGTSKTVSEIAHDVGFDTESYFGAKFRALYGVTPSQYRKETTG